MKAFWIGLALFGAWPVVAQNSAEPALAESQALARESVESQQRIEALDDASRDALTRYRQAIEQSEQLGDYNRQVEAMLVDQRAELARLQDQLSSIDGTRQAIMPLLQRMYQSLERFVALDLPFQLEERQDRLAQLKALLARPNVSVAEKYRRVLEAYQIESDYGRTLEGWRGALEQDTGTRVVDFLRLGRVMLFYQTLDGSEQGYWDQAQQAWVDLPDRYRRALEEGLNIARQQQTPVMLRLPLPPIQDQETEQ